MPMTRLNRSGLFLAAAAVLSLSTSTAEAGYHPRSPESGGLTALELTLGIGVMGHDTTGVPLAGYGYDGEPGPAADAAIRLLFGTNNYFRHGFMVRGTYFSGRQFGRDGYGFRLGLADLTYTARTLLPCISNRDGVRFYASASLGVTGGWANAGTGRGPMNADIVAREAAAEDLDHATLGFVMGGTAELHYGKLLVGISVDMRRLWAVRSELDDHWVRSGALRIGYRWDASDSLEAEPRGL